MSKSEKCMENALEIIEKLNIQHDYSQKKRILLYGDNRYLWQFLCVSTCKKDVEIIGIVTTTHSIQGYIKVYGKETKIIESYEIKNISFDMMLILDENAPSIFTEISQVVNKSKMVIPFMTGIEENEYEIVVKLLPYIFEAENVVDTLSTLHSTGLQHPSGRQPQHMIYDLINYSLFNCMEYRKLGFPYPTIGRGPSDDYMRVRTLELLIDEIKKVMLLSLVYIRENLPRYLGSIFLRKSYICMIHLKDLMIGIKLMKNLQTSGCRSLKIQVWKKCKL